MRFLRFLPALLPLVLIAACSMQRVTSMVSPYRIDIRQGNYITQDMVAQLKPGMTKDQVRFILGTPLVTDIFHSDRWDYVYFFKPGKGEPQERKFTAFFTDGKLTRVAGDVVAAGPDEARATVGAPAQRVIEIGGTAGAAEQKAAATKAERPGETADKEGAAVEPPKGGATPGEAATAPPGK